MTHALTVSHRPQRPSSTQLLARLLASPDLATQVQALPAELLGRVIDRVGLEDAGELIAFATTDQLARVFDEDLWRSERPGEDERFDADRFRVWLSVMLEAGDAFVAEKLSDLPPDLVTLALHKQVLVLDLEAMMEEIRDADEAEADQIEKALSNCLYEEIDHYQLVARQPDGWDDVLTAVLALDRDHHDFLMGVLDRCCAMSAETIDDNGGLYEVLSSEEMLQSDVAAEREDRRAEAGHVAPSDAAAFLKLARGDRGDTGTGRDPITRAYFRGLGKTSVPAPAPAHAPDLLRVLRDAGITEARRPLLPAAKGAEPVLVRAMRAIASEPVFAERSEEIAYVANVLAAGCSFEGRRPRPVEAVRVAIAACSLGLALAGGDAVEALRRHPGDVLFRMAWRKLAVDGALGAEDRAPDLARVGERLARY